MKFTILFYIAFISCSSSNDEEHNYPTPENIGDGWSVSSLQKENIDVDKIDEVIKLIETDPVYNKIHSISIARNGTFVFEKIFSDRYRDDFGDKATTLTMHTLQSVTKSFASTVIGILIDK